MTAPMTLILGGARSGKTKRALELGSACQSPNYIATAEAKDKEMVERIERHRVERGSSWTTLEAPLDLAGAISNLDERHAQSIAVVDCLTLWLSNLMIYQSDVEAETDKLMTAAKDSVCPLIFVSNEVGFGLVPETALGRAFRDAQGRLNQRVAAEADVVELVVSGIPMRLKP